MYRANIRLFEGAETVADLKVTTTFFSVVDNEVELLDSTATDG